MYSTRKDCTMGFDTTINKDGFRSTSAAAGATYFPFSNETVPFILVKAGKITWASSKREKLDMLKTRGGKILAVWPGKWSSDVFEVDDRKQAIEALEPKRLQRA